jgi:putative FmdB family regulatory protein
MPLYEYYCEPCDGIFEQLRPMREASEPWPCPQCNREGNRVMPTSFAAFTYRDGYPRRIPDDGKFWHLGQKVSAPVSGPVKPNEHPEINKPTPPPQKLKGELHDESVKKRLAAIQATAEEVERKARIEVWEKEQANKKPEVPPLAV